jgi:hypothetical protein
MAPTIAKILSRFGDDVWKAVDYCRTLARTYPRLRDEYTEYINILMAQARGDQ